MPLDATKIAEHTGTGLDIANGIVNLASNIIAIVERDKEFARDNYKRGTLITSYATDLCYKIEKENPTIKRAIVVLNSSLRVETGFNEGGVYRFRNNR